MFMPVTNKYWENEPRKENGEWTHEFGKDFQKNFSAGFFKMILERHREQTSYVNPIFKGGNYSKLRKISKGKKNFEVHHMPADSISPLSKGQGPCIIMEKKEHRKTKSFGFSREAQKYRKKQASLIQKGKFLKAEEMDIRTIIKSTGNKYIDAIFDKLKYDDKLIMEGKIDGTH